MTGAQAQREYIGRTVYLRHAMSGIETACRIDDWKQSYGRDRFLLVPLQGKGSAWAESTSFYFQDSAESRADERKDG